MLIAHSYNATKLRKLKTHTIQSYLEHYLTSRMSTITAKNTQNYDVNMASVGTLRVARGQN